MQAICAGLAEFHSANYSSAWRCGPLNRLVCMGPIDLVWSSLLVNPVLDLMQAFLCQSQPEVAIWHAAIEIKRDVNGFVCGLIPSERQRIAACY